MQYPQKGGWGVAWGVVSFLGPWLGFGAPSSPLGGVLDLGSQGPGEGGMEGGGGRCGCRDTLGCSPPVSHPQEFGEGVMLQLGGLLGSTPPIPMVFLQKHRIPPTLSTCSDPFNPEFTPFWCPCLPPMWEETGVPGYPVGLYSHGIFT